MEQNRLAIIIPAYNEANTIADVIERALKFGMVIVIDDHSSDGTEEVSEKAGAIVVRHRVNHGYDGALNTGFEKAKEVGAQYIVTIDADGQHIPELIAKYKLLLENGYQLILGKRPYKARLSEIIMGVYFKTRFNIDDILCGMKGYHIDLYNEYGAFDTMNSIGTELAMYGLTENVKMSQVDIPINKREDRPRFGGLLKANYKILIALIKLVRKTLK